MKGEREAIQERRNMDKMDTVDMMDSNRRRTSNVSTVSIVSIVSVSLYRRLLYLYIITLLSYVF
jgi:hypothetical protein